MVKVADIINNNYEIEALIGRGGMGEVYRAKDRELDRLVAIKVLTNSADDVLRSGFIKEAQKAAGLTHPNIVRVFHFGQFEGNPYFVMEFIQGKTLRELIEDGKKGLGISQETKLRYIEELCTGLSYAHEKGVRHLDIKPENLIIDTESKALKIVDFGIAQIVGEATQAAGGRLPGTRGYMSPEQIRGDKLDCRSDVFSVGAVWYELLTYRRAFEGNDEALNQAPVPLNTSVHPAIQNLVYRALKKDREHRFQDVKTIVRAIAELKNAAAPTSPGYRESTDSPVRGKSAQPPEDAGTKRRLVSVALAGAVLSIALVAATLLWRQMAETSRTGVEETSPATSSPDTQKPNGPPTEEKPAEPDIVAPSNRPPSSGRGPASGPVNRGEAPVAFRECRLGEAGSVINAIALSPDAQFAFTASDDGKLRAWPAICGTRTGTSTALWDESSSAQALAINGAGTRLAAAWIGDGLVRVWNLPAGGGQPPRLGGEPDVLEGHPGPVVNLAFAGREQLVSASEGVVQRWDLSSGEGRPLGFGPAQGTIAALAVARSTGAVISAMASGSLILWDQTSANPVQVSPSICGNIRSLATAATGTLAVGCADGGLIICSSSLAKCRQLSAAGDNVSVAGANGAALTALSFDATGALVAVGDSKGRLTIREVMSGAALTSSDAHGSTRVTTAEFSTVGRRLVSADADGVLRMWDLSELR